MEPPDSDAGLAATIDLGRSFEDSLAVAFELAPVPLLLVDRVGIVRRANEMAAQQTDGGDLIGRSLADAGFDPAGIEYLPSQARSSEFARMSEAAESPGHLQLVRLTDPTAESVVPDSVGNLVHQIADSLPDISTILYDSDLRVVAAGGRPFHRAGFDAKAMAGRSLAEILGESFDDLAPRLRDALTGRESTMDFLSPRNGLEYDVTCRPIRGLGGRVIAGLMTNREVTEDLRRRTQLDEIQRLSQVGSATFDRIHGWTIDADLLRLFGVDAMEEIPTAWETLVLEEDRRAVQAAYDSVLRSGGRVSVRYRLRQPATGEIRDAQGGFMAAVDANGRLVRAVITHVDITAAVAGERLRAKAATDRTQLLRRVSDILAQGTDDRVASIQRIADLASATIGGETLVRVVTLKDGVPDLNLLSDPGTDVAAEVAVRGSIRAWTPPPSRLDPDEPLAHLYSSIGNPAWRDEYRHQTGHPIHPLVAHFISAPVRHDSGVLGFVRAFRLDDHQPFEAGDDDLLQVIADRVGAVLGENVVRTLLERQYDQGRTMSERVRQLTSDQRDLLEQLSRVEEHERLLLAEAIHDGPMQLVVAATMRLDVLSGALGVRGDEVNQLVDLLEEAITTLRTLITALTPPEMNDDLDHGLGRALRHLAKGVFALDDSVEVEVTGAEDVRLSRQRKTNLLRIMREGLTNARKHARATHIRLHLAESGGTVTATICDDGIGATSFGAGQGHLGMATMRGRAAAEGGFLDVRSTPGTGTTLVLTLPVDASEMTIGDCADGTPGPGRRAGPDPDGSNE